jgi:hypothetical protein
MSEIPAGTGKWLYDQDFKEWIEIKEEDTNLKALLPEPKSTTTGTQQYVPKLRPWKRQSKY